VRRGVGEDGKQEGEKRGGRRREGSV